MLEYVEFYMELKEGWRLRVGNEQEQNHFRGLGPETAVLQQQWWSEPFIQEARMIANQFYCLHPSAQPASSRKRTSVC